MNYHDVSLTDDFYKTGEIDIIEGVHDNEHNQVTWHTAPGKPKIANYLLRGLHCSQVAT